MLRKQHPLAPSIYWRIDSPRSPRSGSDGASPRLDAPALAARQSSAPSLRPARGLFTSTPLLNIVIAAAYIAAGWIGAKLAPYDGSVALVWPPMGVAMAAFLTLGLRIWPAIFAGSLLVTAAAVFRWNFAGDTIARLIALLAISGGNTIGPVCASIFLRKPGFDHSLERLRDVLRFIAFAVVLAPFPPAVIAAFSLAGCNIIARADISITLWYWWAPNAIGALIVAPAILTWPRPPWPAPKPRHIAGSFPLVTGLSLINLFIFSDWFGDNFTRYPLTYAVFPFVIWGAIQFGPLGAAVVSILTAFIAMLGTASGHGPFAPPKGVNFPDLAVISNAVLLSTLFLGAVSITALVLAGAFAERSRADAARGEAEARQRALLSAIPDLMFIQDATGKYLDYHAPEHARLLVPPDRFLSRSVRDVLPPHIAEPNLRCISDALRTGQTHSFEYDLQRDDQTRHFEVRVVACAPDRVLTIVRDITERKRAIELLAQSRAALEHAQSVAHIGNWTSEVDPQGGRLTWSKETYRIFGIDEQSFVPRNETFFACCHPDDVEIVLTAAAAAFRNEKPYSIDHRIIRKSDGTVRWVHQEAVVERDPTGRPILMFGVCQDITDRRRLEDQLLQARKMESIGRLAGGVAHDFNNTITAILGFAEMSGNLLPESHPVRTNLRYISDAATHAADLTRQLLAFARKQIIQPRILNLNDQVRKVEPMLRQLIGDQVSLKTSLAAELGPVRADAGQIDQVLVNLAVNARDAMPKGGSLTITTANLDLRSPGPALQTELAPGPYVTLTVTDNGVGMDAETLAHCFDPFYTTKDVGKGTGLGLSTSYGIIKQSDGHITVSSKPSHGCTFTIYLPRVRVTDAQTRPPRSTIPDDAAGRTVLLIEDEALVRGVTAEILRSSGYQVLLAADGDEGITAASDRNGPIDIVITDVVMPRVRGPEAARRIRELRPGLPVLFISGYTESLVIEESSPRERTAFLHKPFTPDALLARVRELTAKSAVHVVKPTSASKIDAV